MKLENETVWLTQAQMADLKSTVRLLSNVIEHKQFLFLWFLEKNGILYKSDGSKLIGNNTLVALTLMIAESRTEEKDVMVKVVINLINKN